MQLQKNLKYFVRGINRLPGVYSRPFTTVKQPEPEQEMDSQQLLEMQKEEFRRLSE